MSPKEKTLYVLFFLRVCVLFFHTKYFQKLLIIIEGRLRVTPHAGSGSGRLAPYLLLADCLALRPGLAWLCQVDGVQAAALVRSGSRSVAFKPIPRAFAAAA